MGRNLVWIALTLVTAGTGAPLLGQGSVTQAHSACAVGTGGAGVAAPCEDGSAVLFNPAALALQPSVIGLGVTGLRESGSFRSGTGGDRTDREPGTSWLPFGHVNYRINSRFAAAVGAFTPFARTVAWPDSFAGRFVSYHSELRNVFLQPTVAYSPSRRFSVGLGLDVVFSTFDVRQRIDLAPVPLPFQPTPGRTLTFRDVGIPAATDYADARLSGRGTGVTFNAGALAQITHQLAVGARYMHSTAIDLEGGATFAPVLTDRVLAPGNPLSAPGNPLGLPAGSAAPLDAVLARQFMAGGALDDQRVTTNIELPAQLVVGVAFTPSLALRLAGDYQWTGWETFDVAAFDFDGGASDLRLYPDMGSAQTLRVGLEYAASNALVLRGGYTRESMDSSDRLISPLLPETAGNSYAVGLGWNLRPGMRLDVGYQTLGRASAPGRLQRREEGTTAEQLAALNAGTYTSGGSVLSAAFSYRFGE